MSSNVRVGRRRQKSLGCPAGVREIAGRWYYIPTKARDRQALRAQGLPASAPLGKAGSIEARRKWAELTGYRDPATKDGTVGELLDLLDRDAMEVRVDGRRRAGTTIAQYRSALPALNARFAAARYGKTEYEASRGNAIGTADIQRFVSESGAIGKRYLAVLKNAFDHGIRIGRTTYNPCDKVAAMATRARTREPQEWELEVLCTIATPVMALILDYKHISGYRISEVLRVHRRDFIPEGIRMTTKGARQETLTWSPRLRAIVAEAEQLPHASRFPAAPLFPSRKRRAYTYSGWESAWVDLRVATNAALGQVIDPDTLAASAPLAIEDLHVHDVRSKVHDDAEEMGRQGHEQLGNTEAVADKHYARRSRRRTPLR